MRSALLAIPLLLAATSTLGRTLPGLVVGPGPGLGDVKMIPDIAAPIPGHNEGKETALVAVRDLIRDRKSPILQHVKLYKFTHFGDPISDFVIADRGLLDNCTPSPARYMSLDNNTGIDYYLVVSDCPSISDPKYQVAAAVGEKGLNVISIVINTAVVPVVAPND